MVSEVKNQRLQLSPSVMDASAELTEQRAAADRALWSAFVSDPSAGVEGLYDRYSKLVYGLARTILADAHEAEDLTHEVFMSLLTRCTYDPARGSLASYLCAMTRSRAIDRTRSRGRAQRLLHKSGALEAQEDEAPAVAEEISTAESARAVRAALARLPAIQRQVLELAYFKGLTQTEIAARLDTPLGTVKSWARRGLFTLRSALGDLVD
jgi:RNA polymerase sigma-70 factor (ECF subfamily)